MTHTQALEESTQQLYRTFAGYQASIAGSSDLETTPLRELTVSQLTPVINQLDSFAEADRVLRYFLPRILELSIDGYHRWSIGLDMVFRSLIVADWRQWVDEEVNAVKTFFHDLWAHHLTHVSPSGTTSSADTLLEACGQIIDVEPMLDTWAAIHNREATAHIASLAVYGKKHHKAVRRWLSQPQILQRIEAAFWDCKDSDHAAMFAKAAEYLRLSDVTPIPA